MTIHLQYINNRICRDRISSKCEFVEFVRIKMIEFMPFAINQYLTTISVPYVTESTAFSLPPTIVQAKSKLSATPNRLFNFKKKNQPITTLKRWSSAF